jgi:hypothetical protein
VSHALFLWNRCSAFALLVGLAVALATQPTACFFKEDLNDCSWYPSAHCFDGGSGDSGPAPACIPSMNSTPVDDSCGVFVSSTTGDDTNGQGTKGAPYKTLGKAVAKGSVVYACAGSTPYAEAVTLDKAVTLFGALDCGSWAYDAAKKTALTAPADAVPLTLTANASGSDVEDFAITAADAIRTGGSSIAVIAEGGSANFTRVDITSGKGRDGAAGMTPTTSVGPTDPTDMSIKGNDGSNACMATASQLGGLPVTNPMCASMGGAGGNGAVGNGSNGDANPANAQTALGGQGQPATDMGTWGCVVGAGTVGENGTPATPGAGAKNSELGMLDLTSGYTGVAGQSGGPGSPGQGGGGGGGAKGKSTCAGASGGSGGAGGCGGNGGTGGQPGGASLGIGILGATLAFDTVAIKVGVGGKGGDGAVGQGGGVGGAGGKGGLGDSTAPATLKACNGGDGGPGGKGGTGGGGRGGHAIGIAYTGSTAPVMKGVSVTPGTAGQGGKGDNSTMGITGDGATGEAANMQGF